MSSIATMPTSSRETWFPLEFKVVYAGLKHFGKGPLTEPIFTREMFEDFRKKHKQLQELLGKERTSSYDTEETESVYIKDIHGNEIKQELTLDKETKMRTLRVADKFGKEAKIYVGPNEQPAIVLEEIIPLSTNIGFRGYPRWPQSWEMKELIERHCPLRFQFFSEDDRYKHSTHEEIMKQISEFTRLWENSVLRQKLVAALQKNAKRIRKVDKVVCFGNGFIGELNGEPQGIRSYIQHLAACTIAKVLGKAQADDERNPNTIDVYAQDPAYRTPYEEILKTRLGIKILDWTTAEGYTMCDKNTIVFAIDAECPTIEPIYDLNYPDGPAGLLGNKMTYDFESLWLSKETIKAPWPKEVFGQLGASHRAWKYKEKCLSFPITDTQYFGWSQPVTVWNVSDPNRPKGEVVKYDYENKTVIQETLDTELLLMPK